jgi:aspartate aminotransferase-like enzyme
MHQDEHVLGAITFGPRARQKLRDRQHTMQSWYLDLPLIEKYWGQERTYYHTAPISMNYALCEALRLINEEGLQARFARHRLNYRAIWQDWRLWGWSYLSLKRIACQPSPQYACRRALTKPRQERVQRQPIGSFERQNTWQSLTSSKKVQTTNKKGQNVKIRHYPAAVGPS